MFNELRWHGIVMCFASLIAVDDASAGWFGPSNYDECILDEMKGRPQYMMGAVKTDCRAKFCTFVAPTNEQNVESEQNYNRCIEEKGMSDINRYICSYSKIQGHYDCT
jgi:hypothetical protein